MVSQCCDFYIKPCRKISLISADVNQTVSDFGPVASGRRWSSMQMSNLGLFVSEDDGHKALWSNTSQGPQTIEYFDQQNIISFDFDCRHIWSTIQPSNKALTVLCLLGAWIRASGSKSYAWIWMILEWRNIIDTMGCLCFILIALPNTLEMTMVLVGKGTNCNSKDGSRMLLQPLWLR